MWKLLHLKPMVSGCPNRCRHCCEEADPPFGALISLDDVKWIVEEFGRAFRETLGEEPALRPWMDIMEITAHPDFVGLLGYGRSFFTEKWRLESTVLSSNGYGLARAEDPPAVWQSLREIGFTGFGTSIYGVEADHDRFAGRKGAYQDFAAAAQGALSCRTEVQVEIHVHRWTLPSFPEIVKDLGRLGQGNIKLLAGIPSFYMGDRLRAFEPLRPTKTEVEAQASAVSAIAERGVGETEATWTRRLTESGSTAELYNGTYQRGGTGPEERDLGWFWITPDFEVIEEFEARPHVTHGNLRRDGIECVWRHVLETEVAVVPDPEDLARRYGDLASEAMHPAAGSVYRLLADRYWREQESTA
jgi:MoaA/NifB/PqqE/SkfB family radical SAM enzyme